jgi:hypothetical protein
MTRIFIEDMELDIDKELSNLITYSIDDLQNLDSKTTSFSKTIILPGTTNNNTLLGNIFEFNNSNFTIDSSPNVLYNFNAAKTAKCRIDVNGLQVIKGVFRLMEIVNDQGNIEYECAVFGELGGFVSAVGNLRLEDLDFSEYDHNYDVSAITASWDSGNTGAGYYYPLIDYGAVSTGVFGTAKKDYQYKAFRPALHVKEYLDKIITDAGYTWESNFSEQDFFKRLIIPNNAKELTRVSSNLLEAYNYFYTETRQMDGTAIVFPFSNIPVLGSFTESGGVFTYTGATVTAILSIRVQGDFTKGTTDYPLYIYLAVGPGGATILADQYLGAGTDNGGFDFQYTGSLTLNSGDTIAIAILGEYDPGVSTWTLYGGYSELSFISANPSLVPIAYGEAIPINDTIPRGIFQKDFFTSLLKMFNLLVTEDKFIDKHLIIEPYTEFYDTTPSSYEDWSLLMDRMKPIKIKPMSEINARYYQLNYKPDNDYYNEGYKKRYNEGYGNFIYDNGFDFSRETEVVEVIFAASVLVGYSGEDKVVSTIFKKTNDIEEPQEHVVRIMQAKKITGVTSWDIMNDASVLNSGTVYPYAGHLDDPDIPNADISFGVPKEIYFILVSGDLSNNLFNAYYSPYMAEITDKDSRLLTGSFLLKDTDIYNLDFSKFKYIDGGLYRLSKIIDYNAGANDSSQVELLRVIYTQY